MVCGGSFSPKFNCNHCEHTEAIEKDLTNKFWICASCDRTSPIQFACSRCGTRALYEEAVEIKAEEKDERCPICHAKLGENRTICDECGVDSKEILSDFKQIRSQPTKLKIRRVKGEYDDYDTSAISRLPGIGKKRASQFCKSGYNSIWKIKRASVQDLCRIPGIGIETARNVKNAANLILSIPLYKTKEEVFSEERACSKCKLPTPIFSKTCLDCGCEFEEEDITEQVETELQTEGIQAIIEFYGQAVRKRSEDSLFWYALALSLHSAGQNEAAFKALKKAQSVDSNESRYKSLEMKLEDDLVKALQPRDDQLEGQELPTEGAEEITPPPIPEEILCPICKDSVEYQGAPCPSCNVDKIVKEPLEVEKPQSPPELETLISEGTKSEGRLVIVSSAAHMRDSTSKVTVAPSVLLSRYRGAIKGRRPLLNGHGLVNGKGRVNGLINGNGFINGVIITEAWLPRSNMFHRYVAVAAFMLTLFLIINTAFHFPVTTLKSIQVDGNLSDWQGIGAYHDASHSINGNINLTSYAVFLEGTSLFFTAEVSGTFFADITGYDSLYIFMDVDSDDSTGYLYESLGADYVIILEGTNASITSNSLRSFRNQDRLNWNHWAHIGSVKATNSEGIVEGFIDTSRLTHQSLDRALFKFLVDDQEGETSESTVAFGIEYGAIKVTQQGITQIIPTILTGLLELNFQLLGPPVTIYANDLSISHTSGTSVSGIPSQFTLSESSGFKMIVSIDSSILPTGTVIEVALISIDVNRPVTILGVSARAYVESPPAGIQIDGLYADWPTPHSDTDLITPIDSSVNIIEHDTNVVGGNMFFYIKTEDQSLRGSGTPHKKVKTHSSQGSGNGTARPSPRLTGESRIMAYIDHDPFNRSGYQLNGVHAKYKVEIKGIFGVVQSTSIFHWEGRWVSFAGNPQVALVKNQLEMSLSLFTSIDENATYTIETIGWHGASDSTVLQGTKGGNPTRTRGSSYMLYGTSSLLYAMPTFSSPTIDGDWDSTEWQDADSYDTGDIIVYTMQNGTYVFIAIRVKSDTVYDAGDYSEIAFDTDNGDETTPDEWDKKFKSTDPDGSTVNEDYNGNGSGWNISYVSPYAWAANGNLDTDSGNYITFEYAIPFQEVWNTSNPDSGQMAGLAIHVHDNNGTGNDYYWGSNDLNDPSLFGGLQLPEFHDVIFLVILMPVVFTVIRRSGKINKPKRY